MRRDSGGDCCVACLWQSAPEMCEASHGSPELAAIQAGLCLGDLSRAEGMTCPSRGFLYAFTVSCN